MRARAMATAVLFVAVCASEARAGPADTTARALVVAWKDADPNIAAVAEVIASAFASGMSWAGAIEGRPVYCPPLACASFRHALGGVGGDADLARSSPRLLV